MNRAAPFVVVVVSAVVAVGAAIGPIAGCSPTDGGAPGGPPKGAEKGAARPVVVRVLAAKPERVERIVEITGTLAGAEEVVVSAEVDGRVEKVVADLGDGVRVGGTLVQLARESARLQAAQADAEYAAALARVGVDDAGLEAATAETSSSVRRATAERDEARRTLARIEELAKKNVAATADVDAARARAEITEASLAAARDDALASLANAKAKRAALGLARKRLGDTTIGSPVDGVVAARLVGLGELVKPGQAVARVVVADTLKLRGDVPERYADAVKRGQPIEIEAADVGARGKGVVGRVGPLVDAASRTFPIEATIDNKDGRWKPGTFARARVVTGADEDVIAVPETAVSSLAGLTKVYVVDDDKKAVERKVQVLRKRGSDALVTGELRAGERVIVTAVARVFAGAVVEVDESAAASAAAAAPGIAERPAGTPGPPSGAPTAPTAPTAPAPSTKAEAK